jgi:hypothetical protein
MENTAAKSNSVSRFMDSLYGRLPVWQVIFDLGEKIWLQSYIRPVAGRRQSLLALMEFAEEALISCSVLEGLGLIQVYFPAVRPVTPSIAHQPAQPFSTQLLLWFVDLHAA